MLPVKLMSRLKDSLVSYDVVEREKDLDSKNMDWQLRSLVIRVIIYPSFLRTIMVYVCCPDAIMPPSFILKVVLLFGARNYMANLL